MSVEAGQCPDSRRPGRTPGDVGERGLLRIQGRERDLGGFVVRRILPAAVRRMVGPFVFFDHMGPADLAAGEGIDVRPHPHIGLATVTYLFEGEIIHRDSLGSVQSIRPGAVDWMTAGRGIVHSERTSPEERARPAGCTASKPGSHCRRRRGESAVLPPSSGRKPAADRAGRRVDAPDRRPRLWRDGAGRTLSDMFISIRLAAGVRRSAGGPRRGVYVVEGSIRLQQDTVDAGVMAASGSDEPAVIEAISPAR